MSFRLRPEAEADIEAITLYIAEHNPRAARAWYDNILRHCRQLGQMPGNGKTCFNRRSKDSGGNDFPRAPSFFWIVAFDLAHL